MVESHVRSDLGLLVESPTAETVLTVLAEGSQTRSALAERDDVGADALDDALAGLTERGWVVREAETYRTTRVGSLVAAQYETLAETASLATRLGDVAELIPVEELNVDLRQFGGADVVRPTADDPDAPQTAVAARIREADRVTVAGDVLPAAVLDAVAAAADGGATADVVLGDAGRDAVTGGGPSERVAGLLDGDATTVVRRESGVGATVGLVDQTAWALLGDDPAAPEAALFVADDVVRAAVVTRHAALRHGGTEAASVARA
jgi:predicted transcriptional regulator